MYTYFYAQAKRCLRKHSSYWIVMLVAYHTVGNFREVFIFAFFANQEPCIREN